MRTLTYATKTATEDKATTPAYLVEIVWSSVIRLSSRGNQSWGGQAWEGGRLGKVSVGESSSIELINSDLAYSTLILNEGAADIPCRIWAFYGDNPDVSDPVLLFEGSTDGADIDYGKVKLNLEVASNRTLFSPRAFIGPATGFNHLRPAGSRLTWGGQTITLERGK